MIHSIKPGPVRVFCLMTFSFMLVLMGKAKVFGQVDPRIPPQPPAIEHEDHHQKILDLLMDSICDGLSEEHLQTTRMVLQRYDNYFELDDSTRERVGIVCKLTSSEHAEIFRCQAVQNSISQQLDLGTGNTFVHNGVTVTLPEMTETESNFTIRTKAVGPTAVGIQISEPIQESWSYTVSSLLTISPEKDPRFRKALGDVTDEEYDAFQEYTCDRLNRFMAELLATHASARLVLNDEQYEKMCEWILEEMGNCNPEWSVNQNIRKRIQVLQRRAAPDFLSQSQQDAMKSSFQRVIRIYTGD